MPYVDDNTKMIALGNKDLAGLDQNAKDARIAAVSAQNPGYTTVGDQRGVLQTGTGTQTVNQQSLTTLDNPTPVSRPTMPKPPTSGTLDSSYAQNFIDQKTNELQNQAISIKNQLSSTTAGGQFEQIGENQYRFGGANGFTFSTLNPYTGKVDPELEKLAKEAPGNLSDFQLKFLVSSAQARQKKEEDLRPQKERFDEQQKQTLATARAGEYYGGRAGAGDQSESVLAKVEQEQARQRLEFDRQVTDIYNQAQAAVLRGAAAHVETLQQELASIPEKIKEQEDQSLDRLTKMQNIRKLMDEAEVRNEDAMGKAIDRFAKSGTTPTTDELAMIDARYGLPEGTSAMQYTIAIKEANDKTEDDFIARADSLVTMLNKMPSDMAVTVNGREYYGRSRTGIDEGIEVDENGQVTHWEYNPYTKEVFALPLGDFGKKADGWQVVNLGDKGVWQVNPKLNQVRPFLVGDATKTYSQVFPPGQTYADPSRDPNDPFIGQCGQFWNDLYGERIIGSTLQEKVSIMEQFGELSTNELQVNDTFIMNAGTTGHIGIINQVIPAEQSPDGKVHIRLTEQNANGQGYVTHDREFAADDKRFVGFFRAPLKNVPSSGPDAPTIGGFAGGVLGATAGTSSGEAAIYANELRAGTMKIDGIPQEYRAGAIALARQQGWTGQAPAEVDVEVPSFQDFSKEIERELAKDPNVGSVDPKSLQDMYQRTVAAIPSYVDAANNLTYKLPGEKKGPAFVAEVKKAVEGGDFLGAQDKLKKVALDTADTLTAQQVRGRDDAASALQSITEDLAKYREQYGDMNIFTGSVEAINSKVGKVNNAEARKIATKIAGALANYRRSISGAAFTESEGKVYESMFPSIMNTRALNDANIQGLLEMLNNSNVTFYRQQLGNQNYETIFGS